MANKSKYLANAAVNAFIRNSAYTSTDVYVALYTNDPDSNGDDPTENEVSIIGTNYARQRIDNIMSAPVDGISSNTSEIDFGIATANYGNVSHFALVTTASGAGKILYWRLLTVTQTISSGNQPKFLIGALSVTES